MHRPILSGLTLAAALLGVSACGVKAGLKPVAGNSLPVAPYGRADQPTAEDLVKTPPQAAPERSVELRKRSEERTDDPFDLPPADE
jgi:hypothetical protein